MANKQEVEALKAKITELEIRLAALELLKTQIVYVPVYQQPYQQPWPYYTNPWYTVTCGSAGNGLGGASFVTIS